MIPAACRSLVLGAILAVASLPALATEPDEILPDAGLEARARRISADLRCLVCQNQSIEDSNAPLARDLRILVRDRLKAGDGDGAVMDYVVSRYGEFVLLKPVMAPHTLLLWFGPFAILGIAGLVLLLRGRGRGAQDGAIPLDPAETERLEAVLAGDEREPDPRPR